MSPLSGKWNYPTDVRFGAGSITELPSVVRSLGMTRPLLITDPGIVDLPITARAVTLCEDAGLPAALFSGVRANPTGQNVRDGVDAFRSGNHDGVIAFGGGSALDAAKSVGLMVGQSGDLFDYEDREDWWTRVDPDGMAPVVALPTTSGTGSEVGRAAVIVDEATHTKKIIFHPRMLPGAVICDPALTLGLPPGMTAATGMDALSHAMEAWCAPGFHPMADGIALEAMRLVHESLIEATEDGQNIQARSQMMAASLMGATAFQKGLGAMHAIAHPVGARWGAHHGTLNAIVMPFVLEHNRSAIAERMERLGGYLGLSQPSFDGVLAWVHGLRSRLGIPANLAAVGLNESDIEGLVPEVLADPSAGGNPLPLEPQGVRALLRRCIEGS
jgi:alcohol dehydrogenase class IV